MKRITEIKASKNGRSVRILVNPALGYDTSAELRRAGFDVEETTTRPIETVTSAIEIARLATGD